MNKKIHFVEASQVLENLWGFFVLMNFFA